MGGLFTLLAGVGGRLLGGVERVPGPKCTAAAAAARLLCSLPRHPASPPWQHTYLYTCVRACLYRTSVPAQAKNTRQVDDIEALQARDYSKVGGWGGWVCGCVPVARWVVKWVGGELWVVVWCPWVCDAP